MESQEQSQRSEETQSNRVATVKFSLDLLQSLLPMGSKILGVSQNEYEHTINVLISHPSFEEVPDHELPPVKSMLVYRQTPYRVEYGAY